MASRASHATADASSRTYHAVAVHGVDGRGGRRTRTLAHTGPLPALGSLIRAGGSFDRMIRDTAARQARLPVHEYPRWLRAMTGSRRTAPFISELAPLIDLLCHAQDIAARSDGPTRCRWTQP